jgi:predicted signal transduction protein with EAL and GGDEF domain
MNNDFVAYALAGEIPSFSNLACQFDSSKQRTQMVLTFFRHLDALHQAQMSLIQIAIEARQLEAGVRKCELAIYF